MLFQSDPLLAEGVDLRGLEIGFLEVLAGVLMEDADIAIAEVIAEDEDDVGFGFIRFVLGLRGVGVQAGSDLNFDALFRAGWHAVVGSNGHSIVRTDLYAIVGLLGFLGMNAAAEQQKWRESKDQFHGTSEDRTV